VTITPPSYGQWQLQCFATGKQQQLPGRLRAELQRIEKTAPRSGLKVGYGKPLLLNPLGTPGSSEVHSSGYRPFWKIPGPASGRAELLMDYGLESPVDFRAYVWGDRGEAWPRTNGWVVRVAPRFSADPLWTTAPTLTPWHDMTSAARRFGSDRAERYSPTWSLVLDPDELSGVLKNGLGNETELHLVASGKPITSIAAVSATLVKSAALVRGSLHIGAQEGTRFDVLTVRDGGLQTVASFPVGLGARASVVRSSDGQQLGTLVHSGRGDWYLYPLDDDYTPDEPLVFKREQLMQTPPACTGSSTGWLIMKDLPVTSLNPPSRHFPLDLAEPYDRWRAARIAAKILASEDGLCVSELAAELAPSANAAAPSGAASEMPPSARIPLIATDPAGSRRIQFRCSR
jgi:hypothetical protein